MMWIPTSLPISKHVHGGLSLMFLHISFYVLLFGPNFYIFVTDLLSMSHTRTKKKGVITLNLSVVWPEITLPTRGLKSVTLPT